jgi:hypothetical protein
VNTVHKGDDDDDDDDDDDKHDTVCAQLHFNIFKELGLKLDSELWYEHVPKSAETSQVGKVTILWNQQVQTDRTIPRHHNPG